MGHEAVSLDAVIAYFKGFHRELCEAVESFDGNAAFAHDVWEKPSGGQGMSSSLSGGAVFEKAGVNFSLVHGKALPAAATAAHPELAGGSYTATGVSTVLHSLNPYVPAAHCNVRFFLSRNPDGEPTWWFGGGFDLTPYYPFLEDAVSWHQAARNVCADFGEGIYERFKKACDAYFWLEHRQETRGVGGLFFDDFNVWGHERCLAFTRAIAESFWPAYSAIVRRRTTMPWGEREKAFQNYRRGRYVEFNLILDRGTLFGLQSRGRTESILMSLPPTACWQYDWRPSAGTPEETLYRDFLKPRDWLREVR